MGGGINDGFSLRNDRTKGVAFHREEGEPKELINFEAGTVGRRRGVRPRISIEPSVPIKTLSGETARLENTQKPT